MSVALDGRRMRLTGNGNDNSQGKTSLRFVHLTGEMMERSGGVEE
jgi:hypothetical protein